MGLSLKDIVDSLSSGIKIGSLVNQYIKTQKAYKYNVSQLNAQQLLLGQKENFTGSQLLNEYKQQQSLLSHNYSVSTQATQLNQQILKDTAQYLVSQLNLKSDVQTKNYINTLKDLSNTIQYNLSNIQKNISLLKTEKQQAVGKIKSEIAQTQNVMSSELQTIHSMFDAFQQWKKGKLAEENAVINQIETIKKSNVSKVNIQRRSAVSSMKSFLASSGVSLIGTPLLLLSAQSNYYNHLLADISKKFLTQENVIKRKYSNLIAERSREEDRKRQAIYNDYLNKWQQVQWGKTFSNLVSKEYDIKISKLQSQISYLKNKYLNLLSQQNTNLESSLANLSNQINHIVTQSNLKSKLQQLQYSNDVWKTNYYSQNLYNNLVNSLTNIKVGNLSQNYNLSVDSSMYTNALHSLPYTLTFGLSNVLLKQFV